VKKKKKDAATVEPLAIVGLSCLFPKADGWESFWGNIRKGEDAIGPVPETHWKIEDYFNDDPKSPDRTYAKRGGFLSPLDFDPLEFGLAPNDIEATDTSQLLGMMAARDALRDAGYRAPGDAAWPKELGEGRSFDPKRTSVILGVTGTLELVIPLGARLGHPLWKKAMLEAGVDEATASDAVDRISEGYVGWQEKSFPGLLGNVVAGRIANKLDLGGTNCVVDAACASSLSALHLASLELASGKSDVVVTGGVDTFNDIFMYMCFSKTPALSPTGNSKPFDADGDGTILGEGIGMLVLKRLSDAERDGDRIHAVIRGIGSSSDGRGTAIYEPSAEGQGRALRDAYRNAGVSPDTIELVEAHGTGTKVGDAIEASALTEVYRDARAEGTWCALGSVKSMIGHTKAAAGVAGILKAVFALENKTLPPTIKVSRPNEKVSPKRTPFYLNTKPRPWLSREGHPRRAAVSALGFGGSNFHCVLEEHAAEKAAPDFDGEATIAAFCGPSPEAIAAKLETFPSVSDWKAVRAAAAVSRSSFQSGAAHRLLCVLERGKMPERVLANAGKMLSAKAGETSWSTPDGAFYGSGPAGKLAFLFPGQGSQYTGMLRDLACQFPEMLDSLAEADAVWTDPEGDARLSDRVYPHPSFDEESASADEVALRDTRTAQPGIGAVSLGAARVLERFGLRPGLAGGHSYGELTALCAGGRLSPKEFFEISGLRGRLMAEGLGDKGSMLAVQAPLEEVSSYIKEGGFDLVLANKNAPSQGVVSGATAEIEKAESFLREKGVRVKRLPVAAAFHSALVAGARKPFEKALSKIQFAKAQLPVYANSSAGVYPEAPARARELLAGQLAKPVEFVSEIAAMHADGATDFLEVGPGARLTGLVGAILGDRPHSACALDASNGKRSGIADLARALAWAASRGYAVALDAWDPKAPEPSGEKKKFTVPISGANYRAPYKKKPPAAKKPPAPSAPVQQETVVSKPQPSPSPAPAAAPSAALPAAAAGVGNSPVGSVAASSEAIRALQQIQQQTAELHARFLEGQERALATMQALAAGVPVPAAAAPAPLAPAPTAASAPALPTVPVREVSAPAPAPSSSGAADPGGMAEALLSIVADKTGYPTEMLNLEMGLDSDLGIDSIKRVEILSALQEKFPGAPAVRPDQLGTIKTLAQVIEHMSAGDAAAPSSAGVVPETAAKNGSVSGGADSKAMEEALLAIVSDKTGYPTEMLNLEMGLDSDLGIDSIKRVEILSALQEKFPGAPAVKPDQLGTIKTLGQVIGHMSSGGGAVDPVAAPPAVNGSGGAGSKAMEKELLAIVAEKTGYPVEMLNLEMGLDSDLGIDSIKRVEILSALQEKFPGAPAVKPDQLGTIKTLGQVIEHMGNGTGGVNGSAPSGGRASQASGTTREENDSRVAPLQASRAEAVETGKKTVEAVRPAKGGAVLIVADGDSRAPALAESFSTSGLSAKIVSSAAAASETPPPNLAGVVLCAREAGPEYLRNALMAAKRVAGAAPAFFCSLTELGGRFGFDRFSGDAVSGALAGLVKTAAREWDGVACKAIDAGEVSAGAVVEECLSRGPVEVGLDGDRRFELSERAVSFSPGDAPVSEGELVIVTGGARGVTAEVAAAIAGAWRPTLVLLGRSPVPAGGDPYPGAEGASLKKAILAARPGVSPKELREEEGKILARREIEAAVRRCESLGAKAVYRSVDARDAAAVAALIGELRARFGPVRGVVHGAGVLADRYIADKTPEQFDRVFGTKVDGIEALLGALEQDEPRMIALFSSTTARYGRKGQADYAMANEALNKIARRERARRANCRVVAFGWGPWRGGMVTPALEKVFESEGVGLIGKRAGSELFVRALEDRDVPAELVVLSQVEGASNATAAAPSRNGDRILPVAFERAVALADHPVLDGHRLAGKPVVPAALLGEWLAHAAMHANPGLSFVGIDSFKVLKGVVLNGGPESLRFYAGKSVKNGDGFAVEAEVRSKDGAPRATARIVLGTERPARPAASGLPEAPGVEIMPGALYGEHLFHGDPMRLLERIEALGDAGLVCRAKTAPAPAKWLKKPLRSRWITDPAALDAAYQAMIVWSRERKGMPSLPTGFESYRQYRAAFPKEGVRIAARILETAAGRAKADIEFLDGKGGLVAVLRGYQCVLDASLAEAFKNGAASPA
jgi:acyl transferase domain-containing protein/predicted hotdog family 3-hydroxylacyl-ACP dehydratase